MRTHLRASCALICSLAACAAPSEDDAFDVEEFGEAITAVGCPSPATSLCASGTGTVWASAMRVGASATNDSELAQTFTTTAPGVLQSVSLKLRLMRPSPGAAAGLTVSVFAAPGGVLPDVLATTPVASGTVLLSSLAAGETTVTVRDAGSAFATLPAGQYALYLAASARPTTGSILVGVGTSDAEAHGGGAVLRRARRGTATTGPFIAAQGLSDLSFRLNFPLQIVAGAGGAREWSDGSVAASCNAYRHPGPSGSYEGATGTGSYTISPTGTPIAVWCDMDFDGGGWTMYLSTRADGTLWAQGLPVPNSALYLASTYAQALAVAGTQVHLRTKDAAATKSVTSVPNATPIVNLRNLRDLRGAVSDWTGPYATYSVLSYGCGAARAYPNSYWACGYNPGGGLHLLESSTSEWGWNAADDAMELYVR